MTMTGREWGKARWTETASASAATATATHAAEAGKHHYVTAVVASYDGGGSEAMVLRDGATAILTVQITDELDIAFGHAIEITAGNAVSIELPTGGAGNTGTVFIAGYTLDA